PADAFVAPENDLVPAEPPPVDDGATENASVPDPGGVPAVAGTLHAPRRWEELIVEAAVIGGVDRWKRRLDGLAADLRQKQAAAAAADEETRAAGLARAIRDLGHLRGFALPLVERLATLPVSATWG